MNAPLRGFKLKYSGGIQRSFRQVFPVVALMLMFALQTVDGFSAPSVRLVGISAQPWHAADSWIPASQSDTVEGTKTLLTMGGWWNESSSRSDPPFDSNGKFLDAIKTNFPLDDAPVQVQIMVQPRAAGGAHEVTPSPIGSTGDGYFLLIEADGIASDSPVKDSGRSRQSHPFYGFNDPQSFQTITAKTDGVAAEAGDLAVAIFVMDNNYNPDIKTQLPNGWSLLGLNNEALDNIGYLACYKIVTDAGAQSLTFNWTDDSTFVAEAAIAILRADSSQSNTPPVLPAIADKTVDALGLLSFSITARDSDVPAQTLTYSLINAPTGASIDPVSGLFTWTPSLDQGPSTNSITVQVTDNGTPNLSASTTFQVLVNAPFLDLQLNLPGTVTIDELTPLDVVATATNVNLLGVLTFGLDSSPEGMAIDSHAGVISWIPTEAQGPGSFTISVFAKLDLLLTTIAVTNSFTVQVNEVNSKPSLRVPADATLPVGTTYAGDADVADPDVPPNSHFFSVISGPNGLSVDGNGQISWPTTNVAAGQYPVVIQVADDGVPSLTDTATFTITVTNLPSLNSNTPPVLLSIPEKTIAELETLSFSIVASDSDVPAQTLTYLLVGAPSGASVDAGTGLFTWTPTADQTPSTNLIVVEVTDNGTPNLSVTNSFQVIVGAFGLSLPAAMVIDELTPLDVLATALNASPRGVLTFGLNSPPNGMTIDSNAGRISWTPTEDQGPGNYTISVVANLDVTPTTIAVTNSFTVQVNEVNSKPVMHAPLDATLYSGILYAGIASVTDSDIPPNSHIFSVVSGPSGLTMDGNGQITWSTTNVVAGQYPVVIQVTDDGVPSLGDTATFTITVMNLPSISIENGTGQDVLSWRAITGQTYKAQYKDDLNAPDWSDLPGGIIIQDGIARLADDNPPANTARFYRIVAL